VGGGACVRACVRACVCVRVCVRACHVCTTSSVGCVCGQHLTLPQSAELLRGHNGGIVSYEARSMSVGGLPIMLLAEYVRDMHAILMVSSACLNKSYQDSQDYQGVRVRVWFALCCSFGAQHPYLAPM
jgi:hypothetical protein